MAKKVVVVTVDTRKFVESILYLGSIGGEIDNKCVVIKGIMMRAEVMVPDDSVVKESQVIRLSSDSVAKIIEKQEGVVDPNLEYTKEQLLEMSHKQIKELTGLNYRSKEKMIAEYLGEEIESEEENLKQED